MITPDSVVKEVCRITEPRFVSVLCSKSNPSICAERDSSEYYELIDSYGLDPLFILAMFNHESGMGRYGSAAYTKSWGNTRPPSFGAADTGTRNGFSVYESWFDGCESTCARLVSDDWYYRDLRTIAEIVPIWAPSSDNNNVQAYTNSIVSFMNTYQDKESFMSQFTVGEGVRVAMSRHGDTEIGHEIWHPIGALPQDRLFSLTPGQLNLYVTHKIFDQDGKFLSFEVYVIPKA